MDPMRNIELAELDGQCAVNLMHSINSNFKTLDEYHAHVVNIRGYLENALGMVKDAEAGINRHRDMLKGV